MKGVRIKFKHLAPSPAAFAFSPIAATLTYTPGSGGTIPSFSTSPALNGIPQVGVAIGYTPGTASGTPTPTMTQQYTLDGSDITLPSPATAATYTPLAGDAGHLLRVRQIATNASGSANRTSASQTVLPAGTVSIQTALALSAPTTGTYPYEATAYMLRGDVPSGYVIDSPDDSTLRSSILSTWDDGSASVVVMSGAIALTATAVKLVALRPVSSGSLSGTDLTTAAITAAVTSVAVNFTATYGGTRTLSTFTAPERIWWTNPQVICARYRLAATTPGSTQLEAVIDIHAYAGGRAFVEVVIENGKFAVGSSTAPADATYTGMTVSVNGTTIQTTSSPATTTVRGATLYATATHQPFRAWYASGWVGGDPAVVVTHDTAYLQRHPLLYQVDQPSIQDFSRTNQHDSSFSFIPGTAAYTPWTIAQHRPSMAAGGDDITIAPLAKWDAQYLQTGNKFARNSVIVNTLAALSFPINYRDSTTGVLTTFDQTLAAGASRAGGVPQLAPYGSSALNSLPYWEEEHPPSVGLMAFLCRPSPVFIEIAQKAAFFAHAWNTTNGTYTHWWAGRAKAWGTRNLAHAMFLTPSALPSGGSRATSEVTNWRAAARDVIGRCALQVHTSWIGSPLRSNPLQVMYGGTPDGFAADEAWDEDTAIAGFEVSFWMHLWYASVLHRIDKAKLLAGHAQETKLSAMADWALQMPCKVINESTAGEWRYQGKDTTIGTTGHASSTSADVGNPGIYPTWSAAYAARRGTPPAASGTWWGAGGSIMQTSYSGSEWQAESQANPASGTTTVYSTLFYSALSDAQERGVTGAAAAWATMNANITNLTTWRSGFAIDPRQAHSPRIVSGSNYVNPNWPAWRRSMVPGTWKKVGSTMGSTANSLNIAALNPLGAGVVGTWQNIPANQTFDNAATGTEDFSAMVSDWCGAAYMNGKLWVIGGGHNAYAGNEVVSIRLADEAPVWKIERPPTGWKGSAGVGIRFADGQEATQQYSNGEPRASHTYDLIVPISGALYMMPGSVFCEPGRQYTGQPKVFKFTPGTSPDNTFSGGAAINSSYGTWSVFATGFPTANWAGTSLVYDPVRNYFYHCRQNSMQRYDLTAGAFLSNAPMVTMDADIRGIYIPGLDVVVYINYFPTGKFWVYKPSTNTAHSPTATGTAPAPIAEPEKGNQTVIAEYFTAAVWVPELGAIVVHAEGGSALSGFHLLTPPPSGAVTTTAWAWSRLEASSANSVTPDHRNINGDYGRFFYSPELKCLGYVSATSAALPGTPNSSGQLNIFALP